MKIIHPKKKYIYIYIFENSFIPTHNLLMVPIFMGYFCKGGGGPIVTILF